ncbi:MAG: hypothetical protein KAQ98_11845 [Bacteriovoracaceae bacterium]|nr:hypothetical protein [Bacteriovoracaceae bacterium]
MNYTSHIECLRNNLCYALNAQKANRARAEWLNETIETVGAIPTAEAPTGAGMMLNELILSVQFFEGLNDFYDKEVSRLISTLLEKTQTEI